ncbi:hypothetical protein KAJ89_04660 [Candidatus Parcubacteria bacterium]|nr:hypothetical protein [Candidatus Parcubacteria bacterium]
MEKKQKLWIWIGVVLAGWLVIGFAIYNFLPEGTWEKIQNQGKKFISLDKVDIFQGRLSKEKIQKKINDLEDLQEKIFEKKEQVTSLQSKYKNQIIDLKKEVSTLQTRNKIDAYSRAIEHPRIRHNLVLMQKKLAYLEKLNQINVRLIYGNEELIYLQRDAQTDIDMVEVIDEKFIKELLDRIDKAIAEYLPDAGKLYIDASDIELKSQEEIWQEILQASQGAVLDQTSKQLKTAENVSSPGKDKIVQGIENDRFDINWYMDAKINAFDVTVHKTWATNLYDMSIEKIVFIGSYVIVGVTFTGRKYDYDKWFDTRGDRPRISRQDLDDYNTDYDCIKYFNLVYDKTRNRFMVKIRKNKVTRAIFVYQDISPKYFSDHYCYLHFWDNEKIRFTINVD